MIKNLPANTGDVREAGSIPGSRKFPSGGHSNQFQYSCLENPHGQRSLVSYNPWGYEESHKSERLSTGQHSLCINGFFTLEGNTLFPAPESHKRFP